MILPVKGLVTRLALQYSDDPSPPPSLTFYDLPSTVVVNDECFVIASFRLDKSNFQVSVLNSSSQFHGIKKKELTCLTYT